MQYNIHKYTQYAAIHYLDCTLSQYEFPTSKIPLLIQCCISLAAKYFEHPINVPLMQSFAQKEYVACELFVLEALNWKLSYENIHSMIAKLECKLEMKCLNRKRINDIADKVFLNYAHYSYSLEDIGMAVILYCANDKWKKKSLNYRQINAINFVESHFHEVTPLADRLNCNR